MRHAALCSPERVCSVPALSLEPAFRRSHGSLYKALALGSVDEDGLRELLVAHQPDGWPQVFAVDSSTWGPRSRGHEPSTTRSITHRRRAPRVGRSSQAGAISGSASSTGRRGTSTAPIDVTRLRPGEDATTATVSQIRRLVAGLPVSDAAPTFVFDAGYDPIALGAELADIHAQVVVRISPQRVFHHDPPVWPPSMPGRRPRHGARSRCPSPKRRPPLTRSSRRTTRAMGR